MPIPSIVKQMNNVEHPHNGVLESNENESNITTYKNMDESHKHKIEKKRKKKRKQRTHKEDKQDILYDSIYIC